MDTTSITHKLLLEMGQLFDLEPEPATLYLPHKRATFKQMPEVYLALSELADEGYVRIYLFQFHNKDEDPLKVIGAELTDKGLNYVRTNSGNKPISKPN
jgi:hypothetical protein